jgi:hypothetical protein
MLFGSLAFSALREGGLLAAIQSIYSTRPVSLAARETRACLALSTMAAVGSKRILPAFLMRQHRCGLIENSKQFVLIPKPPQVIDSGPKINLHFFGQSGSFCGHDRRFGPVKTSQNTKCVGRRINIGFEPLLYNSDVVKPVLMTGRRAAVLGGRSEKVRVLQEGSKTRGRVGRLETERPILEGLGGFRTLRNS